MKTGYKRSCKFPGRKERGMEGELGECLGEDRVLILSEGRFDHLEGSASGFGLAHSKRPTAAFSQEPFETSYQPNRHWVVYSAMYSIAFPLILCDHTIPFKSFLKLEKLSKSWVVF